MLELWAPTVTAFLDAGHTVVELKAKFNTVSLRPLSTVAVESVFNTP